jgi:hypothetical protein
MRADQAGLKRSASLLALVLVAGLSGCAGVDNALFGEDTGTTSDTADNSAPGTLPSTSTRPTAGSLPPSATTNAYTPNTYTPGSMAGTLPMSSAPIVATGRTATITPVNVEGGADTGTAVNKTVQNLRSQVQGLESHLAANAQRLADLRAAGAGEASAYHESKARITTRLQVGTTRGNPELVGEWNTAQAALDQLTGQINGLNALGTDLSGDSSAAHYALDTISATFNVSGAVDEDHRQLAVLEDETNQTIVLIDRLLREVSEDVQRQTAYVANERANLTTLAGAIKNGELYGADLGAPMLASTAPSISSSGSYGGAALVTIRFDRSNVDYQQILYTALTQALQSRPASSFQVVAVSPTRGTASAVQLAQTDAKRHAQEVLRSMTDMGVPATRLAVSSATDPGLATTEVRVFVR